MPLSSIQAENCVLGQMLVSHQVAETALLLLQPGMFSEPRNALVFEAIAGLLVAGGHADAITVGEAVRDLPPFRGHAASAYLEQLALAADSSTRLADHAAVICDCAGRRAMAEAGVALQAAAANSRVTAAEAVASAMQTLEKITEGYLSSIDALPVMTGAELFATQTRPPQYLVEGMLMAGRQVVLYSDPGMGKSMAARHLMVCIATGQQAFGALPTERGVAMYVTGEETIDDLQRGFSIVSRGAGVDLNQALPNLRILACRDSDFSLATPLNRLRLEHAVKQSGARLLVLDTIAALSGLDLKSDMEVLPLLRWASAMTQRLGVTVLWLAHTTKDREASDLDALFGSRQTAAQVDFAYRLLRGKGGNLRLRCAKARGAPNPGELPLRVEIEANASYSLRIGSAEAPDLSVERKGVETAALKHVTEHPGVSFGVLRTAVARAVSVRAETAGQVINDLLRAGTIENRGTAARFQLHARPSTCPAVSAHVPDTKPDDRVPMSRPPKGGGKGHGDTGTGSGAAVRAA